MSEKFENQFQHFSKFGDSKSDGTTISLSQSDKWMKQAKVIDGKSCTTTDTGIAFKKFKSQRLPLSEYNKFIDELASTKKLNADHIRKSMTECGAPGTHSNAGPRMSSKTMNMIMRLTDPSNYTGIHKYRGSEENVQGRVRMRGKSPPDSDASTARVTPRPRSPHSTSPARSPLPTTSKRQNTRNPGVRYDQNTSYNRYPAPVRPAGNRRS